MGILVLVEYSLGALVTFSDPSNAGFSLSSFPTAYPAYLPLLHRMFAAVLIVAWLVLSMSLRGTRAFAFSHMTLGLILIQAFIGIFIPLTQGSAVNNYIIIVHFAVSGLIIAAAGFTIILGWLAVPSAGRRREHKRPEGQ